jgi:hypothetical protein
MSVAIGIETETVRRAEPGLGQVLAGAHREAQGANRSGAAFAHVASSSQPGAESFRSNWQLQLASLVAAADTAGANEAETNASATDINGIDAAAQSIRAATSGNASAPTLPSTAGSALRWSLAAGQDGSSAVGTTRPALLTSREQLPALTRSIQRPQSTGTVGDAKSPQNIHPLDSAVGHAATTSKSTREESASSSAAPDSVLASLGINPLTLPAPGNAIPVASEIPATPIEAPQPVQPTAPPNTALSANVSLDPAGKLSVGESSRPWTIIPARLTRSFQLESGHLHLVQLPTQLLWPHRPAESKFRPMHLNRRQFRCTARLRLSQQAKLVRVSRLQPQAINQIEAPKRAMSIPHHSRPRPPEMRKQSWPAATRRQSKLRFARSTTPNWCLRSCTKVKLLKGGRQAWQCLRLRWLVSPLLRQGM